MSVRLEILQQLEQRRAGDQQECHQQDLPRVGEAEDKADDQQANDALELRRQAGFGPPADRADGDERLSRLRRGLVCLATSPARCAEKRKYYTVCALSAR